MSYLRTLYIGGVLSLGAFSCMNTPEPEVPELPTVDTSKEYTAANIYAGNIYMATSRGWVSDSAAVRAFIDRLKASEDEYPFRRIKADVAPAVSQKLSFSGETALLSTAGKAPKEFTHEVVPTMNNSVFWLIAKEDSVYQTKERLEAIFMALKYYKPVTYTTTKLEPATEAADIQVTTRPEQYASINGGELQFPGINFYVKTKDDLRSSGQITNYLNEVFHRSLVAGDTVLIQGYRTDFK